jgi:site-specific DNA-methyltransferase (adenine-specific)
VTRTATPADVLSGAARWCVVEGDALDVVRALPVACLDAVVTDPPSGIAFMGAEWDRDKGGRAQWVAWLAEVLGLARAATRDGGRALVWSLPRTSHWTGCAVEDAGWSIESTITHLFGTGWPKGQSQLKPAAETWWLARTGRSEALNIDDCRVGTSNRVPGGLPSQAPNNVYGKASPRHEDEDGRDPNVGRYPPNVVLSHAPGCRCVGERRVHTGDTGREWIAGRGGNTHAYGTATERLGRGHGSPDGTELVEAWECVEGCPVRELDAQSGELTSGMKSGGGYAHAGAFASGRGGGLSVDGTSCYGDTGTASRFFPQFPADPAVFGYHAKPSRAERDAGVSLDAQSVTRYSGMGQGPSPQQTPLAASAQGNNHPTVKSIALMRWLVRLVSQRGQVILDTFAGSGTTGVAALAEGRRVILIEREPRFAEIARQRCESVTMDLGVPVRVAPKAAPVAADPRQLSLLGGGE